MDTATSAGTRILVVEDHGLLAETLSLALRLEGYDVHVLPLDRELVRAAVRVRPAISLVELDLGCYGDGSELIAPLTAIGTAVVVLTGGSDRGRHGGCVAQGAVAVFSKSIRLEGLLELVTRLDHGLPVMSRDERDELLEVWRRSRREDDLLLDRFARLTTREREVLGELTEGLSVHEIATRDIVSEATVRTQVKAILAKLEVTTQLSAVALAHRLGWRAHGSTHRRAG
jgi:DNA-binding NarL/FixJ family response regulator